MSRFLYDGDMIIICLEEQVLSLCTPPIMNMLQEVEANRGKTFVLPKKLKVNRLHDLNKRRSVTSSNEIEGIKIKKSREEDVLLKGLSPESKEEFLLYGYNKALEKVFEVYKYQSLSESFAKDLHYFLFESAASGFGGNYKVEQNYIREFDKQGKFVRNVFVPASPAEVPILMGNLIYQFDECLKNPSCNILLTIFCFVLDFLCIHPFYDGNGRVSRLLTTFLLLKYGYGLDEYYSLSYVILSNVDDYYSSLEKSSMGWNEGKNDCSYFVWFMLKCLRDGYGKLSYIAEINSSRGKAKEKVLQIINDSKGLIRKADIEEILVNSSRTSIEKALGELAKEGLIQMVQNGKYAKYYKI